MAWPSAAAVDRLARVFAWAGIGALISFASIGIGLDWGAWQAEIKGSLLNPAWPAAANFSAHASAFWLLCLALLVFGAAHLWAKDRNSKRSSVEVKVLLDGLNRQAKDLSTAISRLQSLPPAGVLEDHRQMAETCEAYFDFARQIDSADAVVARRALEALIRKFLLVVGRFVRTFDGEHLHSSKARYGLNLMLYLPRADYAGTPLEAALAGRLRFAAAGAALDKVAGVLDIVPALSVTTGAADPDERLSHFAVPIAVPPTPVDNADQEQPALPGASRCCINFKHLAYGSVERLAQEMDRSGTDAALKAEMLAYFDDPTIYATVRSFVTVPLFASETGMVGVLNIHRDTPNDETQERLPMFVSLIAPARHQLARLLLKYRPLHCI